jgi:hypothetical protein
MSRVRSYRSRAEAIQQRATYEFNKLADDVRQEVIVPLCKKHHLYFGAAHGIYWFETEEGVDIRDAGDAVREGLADVAASFEVLDIAVDSHTNVGDLVEQVKVNR